MLTRGLTGTAFCLPLNSGKCLGLQSETTLRELSDPKIPRVSALQAALSQEVSVIVHGFVHSLSGALAYRSPRSLLQVGLTV